MKNLMTVHPNAMWRTDAARLRSPLSSRSTRTTAIANATGMKPVSCVAHSEATHPTRRGAPPQ